MPIRRRKLKIIQLGINEIIPAGYEELVRPVTRNPKFKYAVEIKLPDEDMGEPPAAPSSPPPEHDVELDMLASMLSAGIKFAESNTASVKPVGAAYPIAEVDPDDLSELFSKLTTRSGGALRAKKSSKARRSTRSKRSKRSTRKHRY